MKVLKKVRYLDKVFIFVFVFSVAKGDSNQTNSVRIGLLIPWERTEYGVEGRVSAGAVSVAVEDFKSLNLLPGYNVSIEWRDTACNWRQAAKNAIDLHQLGADVLIGPVCPEAVKAVAMLASVWTTPIVTWFGPGEPMQYNSFSTMARMFGSSSKLTSAFMLLLQYFDWKIIGIIMKQNDPCQAVVNAILRENGTVTVGRVERYNDFSPHVTHMLTNIQDHSRVVFLCMPKEDVRTLLLEAKVQDMTSEEYMYIAYEMPLTNPTDGLVESSEDVDSTLPNLLTIGEMSDVSNGVKVEFERRVKDQVKRNPFNTRLTPEDKVDEYARYLYNAVLLYGYAANNSVAQGNLSSKLTLTSFKTLVGTSIRIDDKGDRIPKYAIKHFQKGAWQTVATISDNVFVNKRDILWPGGQESAPKDIPPCGFKGDRCPGAIIAIVLSSIITVILLAIGLVICRRKQQKRSAKKNAWLVDYSEIRFRKQRVTSSADRPITPGSATGPHPRKKLVRTSTRATLGLGSLCSLDKTQQIFASIAHYRAKIVAVKKLKRGSLKMTRQADKDFRCLRELHHENLNSFIGVAVNENNPCVLLLYCSKGSLQDVLENDDINLDWMFKMSFTTDLAKGMEYLHKSAIRSHGNLKSTNCVIDNRWVLKVTDYGLLTEYIDKREDEMGDHAYYTSLLWTAPELLREKKPVERGTQKGDVYSFAIVFYEIMQRASPYQYNDRSPDDVVAELLDGCLPHCRPVILPDADTTRDDVRHLMRICWEEEPEDRPDFSEIRRKLRFINGGKKINIVDNMIKMMEAYTENLEELVAERTEELEMEKEKTDMLLFRMLPPCVAEQLKRGEPVIPETYDAVSIFFSDIVGFTSISAKSSPLQVVDLLNDLYTCFDEIIAQHDVYKVETIGDAYMCVSGLPQRNGDRHAGEIANMALDLLSAVTNFKIRHMSDQHLQLRVGLHTGPCVAGVVGVTMPRYCLFGDTVNMASRMESTGLALHIHLSSSIHTALMKLDWGFRTAIRGETEIKGKGTQVTYWLLGKKGFRKELPRISVSGDSAVGSMENLGETPSPVPSASPALLLPNTSGGKCSSAMSLVESVNDIDVSMGSQSSDVSGNVSGTECSTKDTLRTRDANSPEKDNNVTEESSGSVKDSKNNAKKVSDFGPNASNVSPKSRDKMLGTRRSSAPLEVRASPPTTARTRCSISSPFDLTREPSKSSLKKVSMSDSYVLHRRDAKPKVDFVFPSIPEIKVTQGFCDT